MKTSEEVLKSKLDPKIAIVNNPDYTFNKVIEAMEEYARLKVEASESKVKELEGLLETALVKLNYHADKYQVGNRRINDLMEKVVDPAMETAKRNIILEEENKVLIEVIENTTSREYSGILEHQKEIERLTALIAKSFFNGSDFIYNKERRDLQWEQFKKDNNISQWKPENLKR